MFMRIYLAYLVLVHGNRGMVGFILLSRENDLLGFSRVKCY